MKPCKYLLPVFLASTFIGTEPNFVYAQTQSSLSGITVPKGGTAFDAADANFSALLSSLAKDKTVALTPAGEVEVFLWRGDAYREDRVKFTQAAFEEALKKAGYELKAIDTNEAYINIFEHFDSNDENLSFHPALTKQDRYFRAINEADGKAFLGSWLESDDALAIALLPVAFKAKPKPKPLPAAATGAIMVQDKDNFSKALPAPKIPVYPAMALKPRTVRGTALDSGGKPIVGVEVAVHSSIGGGVRTTHKARTNAQGAYEVLVPTGVAEIAQASCKVNYNGVEYELLLSPVRGEYTQFDSSKGQVQNLILRTTGQAGGTIRLLEDFNSGILEITLKPSGKQLDGSAGHTFVYRYDASEGPETYLNGLPLGRYKLSARLIEDGETLPLRPRRPYGSEAERAAQSELQIDFQPGYEYAGDNANKGNAYVRPFVVALEP